MKRIIAHVLAVLVLACMTAPALAGGIHLILGTPFPHGRTEGDLYGQKKGGWQVGLGYSMRLVDSMDMVFEGSYGEMPNAVDLRWMSPMKVLEASANLKVRMNDKFKVVPYALMGLGVADISILVDSAQARATLSSTEITMKLGGGIDVKTSRFWSFYAEAFAWNSKYVTMIPTRVGIRYEL